MSAKVQCDHCGWIGSEFDCHACLAPVGSEVAFTALTAGSFRVPLAVEVQTSVAGYDGEDAPDTDRPPPMTMRTCYFCGQPATDLVYNGMPTCAPCKQRAVGRRRK